MLCTLPRECFELTSILKEAKKRGQWVNNLAPKAEKKGGDDAWGKNAPFVHTLKPPPQNAKFL